MNSENPSCRTACISFGPGLSVKVLAICAVAFLLSPIFMLALASFSTGDFLEFTPEMLGFDQYRRFLNSPDWHGALLTSFSVSALTSLSCVMLAIPAAIGLTRGRLAWKKTILGLLLAPAMMPVVVLALGYYLALGDLGLIGTTSGLVLAYIPLALPFAVLPIMASLRSMDPKLEQAALNCGAPPMAVFFRITAPLILPGVVTGALFSFMTAFDETVIAIFLCGSTAVTLPKKMWSAVRYEIDPMLPAISTMLIILTALVMLVVFFIVPRQTFRTPRPRPW